MYCLLFKYSSMLYSMEVQAILVCVCMCFLLLCFVCSKFDTVGEEWCTFKSWLGIFKGNLCDLQNFYGKKKSSEDFISWAPIWRQTV